MCENNARLLSDAKLSKEQVKSYKDYAGGNNSLGRTKHGGPSKEIRDCASKMRLEDVLMSAKASVDVYLKSQNGK